MHIFYSGWNCSFDGIFSALHKLQFGFVCTEVDGISLVLKVLKH